MQRLSRNVGCDAAGQHTMAVPAAGWGGGAAVQPVPGCASGLLHSLSERTSGHVLQRSMHLLHYTSSADQVSAMLHAGAALP